VARKLDACGAKLLEWKSVAVSAIAPAVPKTPSAFIGVHNEPPSVVGDARQQRNLSTSLPRFQ